MIFKCLKDFVMNLHVVIEKIKSRHFEHGDLRLENICFCKRHDKFEIVLIDLGCLSKTCYRVRAFGMHSESSCLYSNLEVQCLDYLQLGYMILWIYYVCKKPNHLKSSTHCHKMHELTDSDIPYKWRDPFVHSLIEQGNLIALCNSISYDLICCRNLSKH